jgi:CRISPR-associated protein Cas2
VRTGTGATEPEHLGGKLAAPAFDRRQLNNWCMPERHLYLAAYDICEPRRLRAARLLTRPYAAGGQKSVHEVLLTPAERQALVQAMRLLIDLDTDRFMLLRLDLRSQVQVLGKAVALADPLYFPVS